MNKKVIIVISSFVLILGLILILMFTGIIPNIFVDRSTLHCNRVYLDNEIVKELNYVEIYFDNLGRVKSGRKKGEFNYYDSALAQQDYNDTVAIFSNEKDSSVELVDKTVIVNVPLDLGANQIGLSKKEIKKIYEEYLYECK